MEITLVNGISLYNAMISGAKRIINERKNLNKINVFPIADGDTGNNMSYMMERIILEAIPSEDVSSTIESIANAAISGSRGNSGIIFSEYLNGIYEALKGKATIYLEEFHNAIINGINKAYKAIVNPIEGTILTVMRKAFDINIEEIDFNQYFKQTYAKAIIALEETTNELEILKINKVVDAGAQGMTVFLDGMKYYFETGESVEYLVIEDDHEEIVHVIDLDARYCTEALLTDVNVSNDEIKEIFKDYGTSLIVSGRAERMRIHIHTNQPDEFFMKLRDYGKIIEQKVDDMIRQQQALSLGHSRIAIVTDTIADIPMELLDKYSIHLIPMNLLVDGVSYIDKVTITTDTFYKMLDTAESFSSAQPDKMTIERNLDFLSDHYDNIIVLTVASKLSGTYNAVLQYAKGNSKIKLFDTLQNSGSQGLIVYQVAQMVENKEPLENIIKRIPELIKRTKIYVSVKTLKYMVKLGRVSKVTGLVAKLANLKPVISLGKNGEGIIKKKALSLRGNVKQIIRLAKQAPVESYVLVHSHAEKRALSLAKKLEKILGMKPQYITQISPIVAMNAGIGAIAVALTYNKEVE
ncbi:MAG: DegV family protein [Bacilli bacterium]|nr:DegV family protein [Bacilli bacterium]